MNTRNTGPHSAHPSLNPIHGHHKRFMLVHTPMCQGRQILRKQQKNPGNLLSLASLNAIPGVCFANELFTSTAGQHARYKGPDE